MRLDKRLDVVVNVMGLEHNRSRFLMFFLNALCLFSQLSSLSHSLNYALRKSGCIIGYEPTKMSRDHFWRSISRNTNVEISALGIRSLLHRVCPSNVI